MSIWSRLGGRKPPEAVRAKLSPGEVLLTWATATDGAELGVTRQRLLIADDGANDGERGSLAWSEIAKASLDAGVLQVVPLQPVGTVGEVEVVRDAPALSWRFTRPAGVTDQIHHRVRRSVAASRQVGWDGGSGWLTLRRVAGVDGVTPQLRLDPGVTVPGPEFADAVTRMCEELWHAQAGRES